MENEKPILGYMSPSDEDLEKKREDISNRRALMAGATPLLVGLISGNTGDALEIASKGLIQEDQRKQEEDKTLLSYLRKRSTSDSKSSDKLFKIKHPETGSIRYGTYDEALGQQAPSLTHEDVKTRGIKRIEAKKADPTFGRKLGKDIQGRDVITNIATGKRNIIEDLPEGVVPKHLEKVVDKSVSSYNTQSKKNDEELKQLTNAQKAIGSGQLGDKLAVMSLVKQIETRLSDMDRAYYTANISNFSSLREKINQERTGKLSPRLVKEATKLISQAASNAKEYDKHLRDKFSSQMIGRGVSKKMASSVLGKSISTPTETTKTTVTNGKETYEIDINDLGEAMRDGFEVVE